MEYKPLTDLAHDEASCKKIFDFMFPMWDFDEAIPAPNKNCLNFFGITDQGVRCNVVSLWSDGIFHFGVVNGVKLRFVRYFHIVDFIRSLGYSA